MRKYILSTIFLILGIFISILFYISNYGIKTEKFNNLIIKKIKQLEPRISLEINDVFLKLNLTEKSIIINTEDPKIYIDKNFIDLSDININLSFIEFIKKSNSINKIQITTKENSIKNITNFLKSYKFNIPLIVAYNQIESGSIKAKATLYTKKGNYKKINYEINGNIINANLNVFNKEKINNINLDFNFKDQKIDLKNINLNYDNIKLKSDKISILKNDKNYEVNGSFNNEKGLIKPNSLFNLLNFNFNILEDKHALIETENKFSFKINSEKSIKDLKLKSKLKFDKIFTNKNYQNLVFFKNGNVKTIYSDKNLKIEIDSGYSFIKKKFNNKKEGKNNIKINIKKDNNKDIKVESFFKNENFEINSDELNKYIKFDQKIFKSQDLKINSDNKVNFSINKKNKIKNLSIKSILNIGNTKVDFISKRLKNYLPSYSNKIYLNNNYVEIEYSKDKTYVKAIGEYSFKDDYDNYEIDIFKEKNKFNFKSFFELKNSKIKIKEIDYTKPKKIDSKIRIEGYYINNDELKFKDIEFLENNNKISLFNLSLSDNYKINYIDKIELNYFNNNKKLNYLKVYKNKNNYEVTSNSFDGESLIKNLILGNSNTNNKYLRKFKNLNSKILIKLDKLYVGHQSYLKNLQGNLIIKNNKLFKGSINALLNKNDKFSYNLKTDTNEEQITNIFIEKPEPFIKNYKFIKGFKEGSLSYYSISKNDLSKSQLKIYDFKVKEVPILAKLLTLASLQGIADLLTGEGIRFDEFEMNYESTKTLTTIEEIYAIGPAMSIMIDGYLEKNKLTSLRGTLVPATTINNTIAKIPLLGKILVGSKVGEGVFGVSFKIKGPPKNLKTTVNPIKTLTPRFITRTLEKIKKTN
tara:strand:- start:860 stop:3460 length:2601 start_codon:yes stop_codon:yes gene_type:complete